MPFAQLLLSKKVLWESDRDIEKSQTKRGRGHEEIAMHKVIPTVYMTHNPFSVVFLGLQ